MRFDDWYFYFCTICIEYHVSLFYTHSTRVSEYPSDFLCISDISILFFSSSNNPKRLTIMKHTLKLSNNPKLMMPHIFFFIFMYICWHSTRLKTSLVCLSNKCSLLFVKPTYNESQTIYMSFHIETSWTKTIRIFTKKKKNNNTVLNEMNAMQL